MNNTGTYSYGCCRTKKEVRGVVAYLTDIGEIPKTEQSVTLCKFKNKELVEASEVKVAELL